MEPPALRPQPRGSRQADRGSGPPVGGGTLVAACAFPEGALFQRRRRPSRPRARAPRARVPGAAGPELPEVSVPPPPALARGSPGRPGPRPTPLVPRGRCIGYGGRDGGRSLAPGRRGAGLGEGRAAAGKEPGVGVGAGAGGGGVPEAERGPRVRRLGARRAWALGLQRSGLQGWRNGGARCSRRGGRRGLGGPGQSNGSRRP